MIQTGPPLSQARLGTPPNSPSLSARSSISEDAHQDVNQHCHYCHAQPGNRGLQISSPTVTREDLKQLFLELLQAKSKSHDSAETSEAAESDTEGEDEPKDEIARASKLEFKTVNEVYVSDAVQVQTS